MSAIDQMVARLRADLAEARRRFIRWFVIMLALQTVVIVLALLPYR